MGKFDRNARQAMQLYLVTSGEIVSADHFLKDHTVHSPVIVLAEDGFALTAPEVNFNCI